MHILASFSSTPSQFLNKDFTFLKNSLIHIMNEDAIMEERKDCMLSPAGDSHPTLRTAHFLKPVANSMHVPSFPPTPSSSSSVFEPKKLPLKIHFSGWSYSQQKWVYWVDQLKQRYESMWKKAGIFEAIMSTKWCYIIKDQNLLYGVVEKWCCETNTFVFSFGEATVTLEDIMVLGGYPILGDPVFTSLEDQEMKEIEEKLKVAREGLCKSKQGKPRTSIWMDIFIDKGNEIEHEAFLVTWLSIFVFPHNLVKSSLFPIAIRLARGDSIALAPAVLASLYKDLTLFNKTIAGLSKYPVVVGGDVFPLEVTLESPFYLVQIWVWERFKNLQPQPMLINHGDPLLLRWHKVEAMKIDNVRLALDSAIDDFLWRPYVRYADKRGMFYPNGEFLVPFKKDLGKKMLSFVTCMRVSELVGFESIEQYLPHRVSMQFGMDQDVPNYVPRFNKSKSIAWTNFCRPISDINLYFPSRFFEADVTICYAEWWRQSTLGRDNFVKSIVKQKRTVTSSTHRPHVGKFSKSGNVGVHPGFPPHLVDTLGLVKFCDDGSKTKTRKVGDMYADAPSKHNTLVPSISVEKSLKDESGSKKEKVSSDKVCLSETQGESKNYAMKNKVSLSSIEFDVLISSNVGIESSECGNVNDINEERVRSFTLDMKFDLENNIQKLERVISKLKEARFGHRVNIV